MARWLIRKDGNEVSYYRNGRDEKRGFSSVEEARKAIKKSRKYKDGDKIILMDAGK